MAGRVEMGGWVPPDPMTVGKIITSTTTDGMRRALAMTQVEALSRMERSRRTGHAMRSVASKVEHIGFTVTGVIGSNVFYVRYLEEGTGLYGPFNRWIVPKRSQFLRFPEPGNSGFTLAGRVRTVGGAPHPGARYVYARRVRGIRPRRYFRDAALVTRPKVEAVFRETGELMVERIRLAGRHT